MHLGRPQHDSTARNMTARYTCNALPDSLTHCTLVAGGKWVELGLGFGDGVSHSGVDSEGPLCQLLLVGLACALIANDLIQRHSVG
jgi:hypothetical protein